MASEDVIVSMLPAVNDVFGGVVVDMKEFMEPQVFEAALGASIARWKHEGKKGIWIKLPIQLANLLKFAVEEGFWYHHAEHDHVMLVKWIPETVCTIPENATHRVGICAIVLTEKREVLVVHEQIGAFQESVIWKLPTGLVDQEEDICMAAIKEVKEKTGVDAEFVDVVAFRQTHKSFFNKSEFFFLCFLRPSSFIIQTQHPEVEAAKWMPIEEFASQPFTPEYDVFKHTVDICRVKLEKGYTGFAAEPQLATFDDTEHYLYINTEELQ